MEYVQLQSGTVLETKNPEIWPEAKRLPKAKGKAILKAEAIKYLRSVVKPGDTVYSILRNVSTSGMSRRIQLLVIKKNKPISISGYAARAMDRTYNDSDGGIQISGCGMDMGFALVYDLGRTLFPKGFKVKGTGRNGDTSGHDKDGGYALKNSWL